MKEHPIRRRRAALGLKQGQLAEATGMTREALNRLERGRTSRKRGPQGATLRALGDALNVDPEVLEAEVQEWIESCRSVQV